MKWLTLSRKFSRMAHRRCLAAKRGEQQDNNEMSLMIEAYFNHRKLRRPKDISLAVHRWRRRVAGTTCEHPGCTQIGEPRYFWDISYPAYFLCAEHAFDHGFCPSCDMFYGGCEWFEFGPGVCENCREDWENTDDDDEVYNHDYYEEGYDREEELYG